jgi:hypothetical protein
MEKKVVLSFGVTADEEVMIRHRMQVAGETNLSAHVRRVYFSGGNDNDALLGRLQHQIDLLTDEVMQSQRLLRLMASQKSDDMELQLLAGIYMMLHPSVDIAVRSTVDKYFDINGIEGFLRDKKVKR